MYISNALSLVVSLSLWPNGIGAPKWAQGPGSQEMGSGPS